MSRRALEEIFISIKLGFYTKEDIENLITFGNQVFSGKNFIEEKIRSYFNIVLDYCINNRKKLIKTFQNDQEFVKRIKWFFSNSYILSESFCFPYISKDYIIEKFFAYNKDKKFSEWKFHRILFKYLSTYSTETRKLKIVIKILCRMYRQLKKIEDKKDFLLFFLISSFIPKSKKELISLELEDEQNLENNAINHENLKMFLKYYNKLGVVAHPKTFAPNERSNYDISYYEITTTLKIKDKSTMFYIEMNSFLCYWDYLIFAMISFNINIDFCTVRLRIGKTFKELKKRNYGDFLDKSFFGNLSEGEFMIEFKNKVDQDCFFSSNCYFEEVNGVKELRKDIADLIKKWKEDYDNFKCGEKIKKPYFYTLLKRKVKNKEGCEGRDSILNKNEQNVSARMKNFFEFLKIKIAEGFKTFNKVEKLKKENEDIHIFLNLIIGFKNGDLKKPYLRNFFKEKSPSHIIDKNFPNYEEYSTICTFFGKNSVFICMNKIENSFFSYFQFSKSLDTEKREVYLKQILILLKLFKFEKIKKNISETLSYCSSELLLKFYLLLFFLEKEKEENKIFIFLFLFETYEPYHQIYRIDSEKKKYLTKALKNYEKIIFERTKGDNELIYTVCEFLKGNKNQDFERFFRGWDYKSVEAAVIIIKCLILNEEKSLLKKFMYYLQKPVIVEDVSNLKMNIKYYFEFTAKTINIKEIQDKFLYSKKFKEVLGKVYLNYENKKLLIEEDDNFLSNLISFFFKNKELMNENSFSFINGLLSYYKKEVKKVVGDGNSKDNLDATTFTNIEPQPPLQDQSVLHLPALRQEASLKKKKLTMKEILPLLQLACLFDNVLIEKEKTILEKEIKKNWILSSKKEIIFYLLCYLYLNENVRELIQIIEDVKTLINSETLQSFINSFKKDEKDLKELIENFKNAQNHYEIVNYSKTLEKFIIHYEKSKNLIKFFEDFKSFKNSERFIEDFEKAKVFIKLIKYFEDIKRVKGTSNKSEDIKKARKFYEKFEGFIESFKGPEDLKENIKKNGDKFIYFPYIESLINSFIGLTRDFEEVKKQVNDFEKDLVFKSIREIKDNKDKLKEINKIYKDKLKKISENGKEINKKYKDKLEEISENNKDDKGKGKFFKLIFLIKVIEENTQKEMQLVHYIDLEEENYSKIEKEESNNIKENSNIEKEESNNIKKNPNIIKENSNIEEEESNNIKKNPNIIKEDSNNIKEESNNIKEKENLYPEEFLFETNSSLVCFVHCKINPCKLPRILKSKNNERYILKGMIILIKEEPIYFFRLGGYMSDTWYNMENPKGFSLEKEASEKRMPVKEALLICFKDTMHTAIIKDFFNDEKYELSMDTKSFEKILTIVFRNISYFVNKEKQTEEIRKGNKANDDTKLKIVDREKTLDITTFLSQTLYSNRELINPFFIFSLNFLLKGRENWKEAELLITHVINKTDKHVKIHSFFKNFLRKLFIKDSKDKNCILSFKG